MPTGPVRMRRARNYAFALLAVMTLSCAKTGEDAEKLSVQVAPGEVADADERTAITVDAAARNLVLIEMRTMLKAVQGIVAGAANRDSAAMERSATMAGLRAASEVNPAVQQQLGSDFLQLGMSTHARFDSLAADVARGNRDMVLQRLAGIMGNCVGCHEKWRLNVQ